MTEPSMQTALMEVPIIYMTGTTNTDVWSHLTKIENKSTVDSIKIQKSY